MRQCCNGTLKKLLLMSTVLMAIAAPKGVFAHEVTAGEKVLREHNVDFHRQIVEVTPGVYVAVGYSAANVTLIQGKNGSIIVDTSANPKDAKAIIEAFGSRLIQPVRAIVYTHNHPDHSGGATVFADHGKPEIISHSLLVTAKPDTGRGKREEETPLVPHCRMTSLLMPVRNWNTAVPHPTLVKAFFLLHRPLIARVKIWWSRV